METPEKILITQDEDTKELSEHWCLRNLTNNPHIEYINKDAFIEKACVKLKKLMYDNLMFQGRLHREEVIDNFVEGFKNYLELNSFS